MDERSSTLPLRESWLIQYAVFRHLTVDDGPLPTSAIFWDGANKYPHGHEILRRMKGCVGEKKEHGTTVFYRKSKADCPHCVYGPPPPPSKKNGHRGSIGCIIRDISLRNSLFPNDSPLPDEWVDRPPREVLYNLVNIQQLPIWEIAKRYSQSPKIVRRALRACGITVDSALPCRPKRESIHVQLPTTPNAPVHHDEPVEQPPLL